MTNFCILYNSSLTISDVLSFLAVKWFDNNVWCILLDWLFCSFAAPLLPPILPVSTPPEIRQYISNESA